MIDAANNKLTFVYADFNTLVSNVFDRDTKQTMMTLISKYTTLND